MDDQDGSRAVHFITDRELTTTGRGLKLAYRLECPIGWEALLGTIDLADREHASRVRPPT